jgi:hypothetical protein
MTLHTYIIVFHDPKRSFSIIQEFLSTFPVYLVSNVNYQCIFFKKIYYKYNKQYYFFTLTHHNYKIKIILKKIKKIIVSFSASTNLHLVFITLPLNLLEKHT